MHQNLNLLPAPILQYDVHGSSVLLGLQCQTMFVYSCQMDKRSHGTILMENRIIFSILVNIYSSGNDTEKDLLIIVITQFVIYCSIQISCCIFCIVIVTALTYLIECQSNWVVLRALRVLHVSNSFSLYLSILLSDVGWLLVQVYINCCNWYRRVERQKVMEL